MTDDEINIAIAAYLKVPEKYGIPNFSGDLNAMHEAEKMLNLKHDFEFYYASLFDVTKEKVWPVHATARQRAEALLRTVGLWKATNKESLTVKTTTKESSANQFRDATKARIEKLESALIRIRDCDFVISLPDRMDAVRKIAREALQ